MTVAAAKIENPNRDNSRAYGRPPARHDPLLSEVGPGTPLGELLRRYWQPVALSENATNRPRKVRLLGEDLILFRDGAGKPGLLYPRCMHRGTTLYYGHVEDRGIRCCYHGWLFDVEGNCLEQPCEPDLGKKRDQARQPWYPVQERYGIIFAYLGPSERQPLLPRYSNLEDVGPGEEVWTRGGDGKIAYQDPNVDAPTMPYNWLQFWENIMDPFHVWILHSTFTDAYQFAEALKIMPSVAFRKLEAGVTYEADRVMEDGRTLRRVGWVGMPNIGSVGSVQLTIGPARGLIWVVPVDDENTMLFAATVGKDRAGISVSRIELTPDGKTWSEMTEAEHQDYPGDFEAQFGQGRIALHSDDHLVQSDVGVASLRRLLKQQVAEVEAGNDPHGVIFEGSDLIEIPAGNFILKD